MRVFFRLIQKQFGNRLDCIRSILRLRRAKVQIHYLVGLGRAEAGGKEHAGLTLAAAALSRIYEICLPLHLGVLANNCVGL